MTKRYERILVAVDGSKAAEAAFEKAVEIAKRNAGDLYICHIIDTRSLSTVEQYDQTIFTHAKQKGEDLLSAYQNRALENGVTSSTILELGSPKVKISKDVAHSYQVDLIVTGATGLNALERFLMGSVSEAITRHATCDVLIVRNP
ncbi:universal stress protein [Alkalihalobacillus sp. LMS39]|uniref:universal stress protein n=1 Tax=Alkalihalobacillus sp. LMS39 TaxID=2924032 RepID=UPI001FB4632E|nr:universal stress protein [Alkalihalobacillus sp. LMS39]UOE93442.1 universal stress protein [Alkalihalobacillus sp. LMS39]